MAAESHARVMSQSSKSVATSEMLIELVRNYPVLFDKRHVKHKDVLKDELWNKIGSELRLSGKCMFYDLPNLVLILQAPAEACDAAALR